MSKRIRIAVMGLGWVARNRHIPALLRHPDFELVGFIDPKKEAAHDFAALSKRKAFSAQSDALKNVEWLSQVDALCLATPPEMHAALAIEALRLGKHIFVEKPFVLTQSEGDEIQKLSNERNLIVAVNHNFLFASGAKKLFKDVAQGKLGAITSLAGTHLSHPTASTPKWIQSLPLGALTNELPHFLSLMQELAKGDMSLRDAFATYAQEDAAEKTPRTASLHYQDSTQTPLSLHYDFHSSINEWFMRVNGTKATGLLDLYRDIYIRLPHDKEHHAQDVLKTSAFAIAQHIAQHVPHAIRMLKGQMDYGTYEALDLFAQAVRGPKPPVKIGLAQALATLKLQNETTQRLQENRPT